MPRFVKRYLLWFFYAAFFVLAVLFGGREPLTSTESPYGLGKYLILIAFIAFVAFSLYATHRENFFRSIAQVNRYLWGRQVGIDLYISVFLSLGLIYLVEGSLLVMLLWAPPIIVFANLAILPYILLNYGAIVSALAAF